MCPAVHRLARRRAARWYTAGAADVCLACNNNRVVQGGAEMFLKPVSVVLKMDEAGSGRKLVFFRFALKLFLVSKPIYTGIWVPTAAVTAH